MKESQFQTFLAFPELLISLKALAPLSKASGSNPADVVLGLSFLIRFGSVAGGFSGSEADCGGGGEEVENGLKLKVPSA